MSNGDMKLYVWQGEGVLRICCNGVAVVAARSEEEAWKKLQDTSYSLWFWLMYGSFNIKDSAEGARHLEILKEAELEYTTYKPTEYTIDQLPVIQTGIQYTSE